MGKINDIYEWMESYLLGHLDESENKRIEEKIKMSKEFAEDFRAMEVEMYEEGLLPEARRKMFEERLKTDHNLATELALHIATFEVVNLLEEELGKKDSSSPKKQPSQAVHSLFSEQGLQTSFKKIKDWFRSFVRVF